MGGKIEHIRVLIEGVLCAVAVMKVPVHDQASLCRMSGHGIHGAEGHVIEKTKSHCAVSFGMMSGGSDYGETISYRAIKYPVCEREQTADCEFCRLIGKGRSLSVRVKRSVGQAVGTSQLFDMRVAVNPFQFIVRGGTW